MIEIDLSEAPEAIVIEATITADKMPFVVLISKTSPYFGANSDNPVSGAAVSVRSERGKAVSFTEWEPGKYILEKIHH